ncbi:hypothetical protein [Enterobacter sp.]|uniref:hypothetical protein n=1 Tax=Enterobacter sp. TaxID=42895 RepID=UPI00296FA0E8|nr:hypothetical protein [Enterobacter sp.]
MSKLPEQVKIYSSSPSDMSPPVDDASFCVDFVLATDYEALQAERDQLAAECAALKNFIIGECYVAHIEAETFYEEEVARYVSADGYEPETPATGRFLAEQQSIGIQKAAASGLFSNWVNQSLISFAVTVRNGDESAQLRNEVNL